MYAFLSVGAVAAAGWEHTEIAAILSAIFGHICEHGQNFTFSCQQQLKKANKLLQMHFNANQCKL